MTRKKNNYPTSSKKRKVTSLPTHTEARVSSIINNLKNSQLKLKRYFARTEVGKLVCSLEICVVKYSLLVPFYHRKTFVKLIHR